MPWQRQVADVAGEFELDEHGRVRPVFRTIVVTVPRQSGKTTLLLAELAQRCTAWPVRRPQRVIYTAQTRNDAREKWEEHYAFVSSTPLGRLVEVDKTNGREVMRWRNGSRWGLTANTPKSGHGKTLDLGVIDEAFAHIDNRAEQAMRPAMLTRTDAQLWIISTAGTAESTFLRGWVDEGRARVDAGERTSVAYFEWSAADTDDPWAESTWLSCMPALGHTITLDTIRAEAEAMRDKPDEFARAYLNRWTTTAETVIPLDTWHALADPDSTIAGPLVLAVDMGPERAAVAIAAAGTTATGRRHVEVIDHRPGTDWVAARVAELVARWNPQAVIVDPAGPAGGLLPALTAALPHPDLVRLTGLGEHAQAAGHLLDLCNSGTLAHLGQPELDRAVAGAVRRLRGDSWTWARRTSAVDIAPLVAVTLAAWGANTPPIRGGIW